MIPAALLLIISSFFCFKINYFLSVKDSQNIFIKCSPVNISCLFSMLLNEDIVDIKRLEGICSLTFVVDEFSELFLYPSIFFIIHSRSA